MFINFYYQYGFLSMYTETETLRVKSALSEIKCVYPADYFHINYAYFFYVQNFKTFAFRMSLTIDY